jgi:predicted phage-related endonuclease
MNLRKQYQRLFEGRAKFAKANNLKMEDSLLNEAPMVQAFPKMKTDAERKAALEPGAGVPGQDSEPIDIEYYSDQLNKIIDTIRDFQQDIGTEIEMKGEETGDYQYETMEKQLSRYIIGAEKQLESLQKYLERQKGKGL